MELRHLRYFIAVAEEMNVHRAAERLHISQPPLSLTIKQLETELGVALFTREGRGIQITRAGQIYLQYARKILSDAETASEQVRQSHLGLTGRIKIGFASSAITGPLQKSVSAFKAQYPDVIVDMEQMTNATIPQRLIDKDIDIGLVRVPEYIPDTLMVKDMTKECWCVALPEHHELTKNGAVTIKDLADIRLIFYPRWNNPGGYDDVMNLFREKDVEPRIYQEAPEQMTIAGLVASGVGVGIVPECMATIKIPGVIHRPIKGTKNRTGFAVVTCMDDDLLIQNYLGVLQGE